VARDIARLNALAARLRAESRVGIDVLGADLTERAGIEAVEPGYAMTRVSASW